MSQLHHDWLFVLGGELAGANQGCGTMLSGESLFFFQVRSCCLTFVLIVPCEIRGTQNIFTVPFHQASKIISKKVFHVNSDHGNRIIAMFNFYQGKRLYILRRLDRDSWSVVI
jgi:hypothetical protein